MVGLAKNPAADGRPVGVGKRSIASFAALDALFKMGIGLWGRFLAVAAPQPKI